ncbi:MAG: mercury(II) reductase [Gemmatimonadaceae bacterium]|nr:mercury(II) reductase [Gemmatimonadaceae bacterium]
MTCPDCSRHIAVALNRVEGVTSADVDYRAARAHVSTDTTVSVDALIAAVERAGYAAKSIANDEAVEKTSSAISAPHSHRATAVAYEHDAGFDLLVIGTGGAGVAAAIQAAGMGGKVAIVEAGVLGGTCVNVGCIPSKYLIEAASHYHTARKGFPGIAPCSAEFDWTAIIRSKGDLVTQMRGEKYADVLASYPGVALLKGRARLAGGGHGAPVIVTVGEGNEVRTHKARKVIVATGARPAIPPINGADGVGALDSTTVMELSALPHSMLVLGGSAVGLELGQMFARFGVKVTVVEIADRLLPSEDEAVSSALEECLQAEGLEIHTGTVATAIERDGNDVVMHVQQGSLEGTLRGTRILFAAGRRPNTDDLGLESVGVSLTDRGFVTVDATMRTSNPDIFAAGDVTGGPGYVYVAAAGARIAAENAMKSLSPIDRAGGEPREFDLSVVPNVTFTFPQVGSVGLTEQKARELGHSVQVSTLDMAQLPRALVSGETRGFVKMVAEAGSGKLLGFHAVAPLAGELMGEASLAIRFGLTARDLSGTLHPYLTWAESVKLAAQGFTMDISKLSCCA